MKFKVIFGLVLLAVILLFVQENSGLVPIRMLQWQQEVPLALTLLLVLLAGVIIGLLMPYSRRHRKQRLQKKAEKEKLKTKSAAQTASPATQEPGGDSPEQPEKPGDASVPEPALQEEVSKPGPD